MYPYIPNFTMRDCQFECPFRDLGFEIRGLRLVVRVVRQSGDLALSADQVAGIIGPQSRCGAAQ